jgi:hypothetical protein
MGGDPTAPDVASIGALSTTFEPGNLIWSTSPAEFQDCNQSTARSRATAAAGFVHAGAPLDRDECPVTLRSPILQLRQTRLSADSTILCVRQGLDVGSDADTQLMSNRTLTPALATVVIFTAIVIIVIVGGPRPAGPLHPSGSASRTDATAPPDTTPTASTTLETSSTIAPPTVPASTSNSPGPSTSASSSPPRAVTVTRAPAPTPGTASATSPTSIRTQSSQSYNYTSVAPTPPTANIPATPDFTTPCHTPGEQNACITDTVEAINNAHAIEGIPPMQLPSDFSGLSLPNQVFVLVNLERVDRKLSPVTGELASLDQLAQVGAQNGDDPVVPSGLPGVPVSAWGANWASTGTNVDAVYEWMYNDGLGGFNKDCDAANLSRCWDHRDTILGFQNDITNYGGSLSFGADTVHTGTGNTSVAMVITWSSQTPSGYYYLWSQAVADGAL